MYGSEHKGITERLETKEEVDNFNLFFEEEVHCKRIQEGWNLV